MDYKELGKKIQEKTILNNIVNENTTQAFSIFKETAKSISKDLEKEFPDINTGFTDKGEFEFEIRFGTDVLVFLMHSNVFEFSRMHDVMQLPYVKQDKKRSYCGMISIYNFLADSFDYNRIMDYGYLIARIFVNNENHYFIEGKREVGALYTSFSHTIVDNDSVRDIIMSSMDYTNSFDLLTPPFDEVKIISVDEINSKFNAKRQITAKRLGFEFKQDKD